MSRLIDADKIDFNEVFVGASEFAQDTRNAAQMLIDNQPTAFDLDKVAEQLEELKSVEQDDSVAEIISTRIWNKAIQKSIGIVKGGGVE